MSTLALSLSPTASGLVVACPSCGQRNRVPYARLDRFAADAPDGPRCGGCHTPLPALAQPLELEDDAAFAALVDASPLPLLVDFWAAWCGPCRMVAPEVAKVAAAARGRYLVAKLDTEAAAATAARLGIRSIPTMAVFRGGRELARTSGARPASQIERFVHDAIVAAG